MEITAHFDEFIDKEVNLNKSRLESLNAKIKVFENFFKENERFKDNFIKLVPQGSYGHKTIIKPPKDNVGFDADILLYMKPFENWQAKDYIDSVYDEFYKNKLYSDIVKLNTRCVTIDYKAEYHIDVVPFITLDLKNYITNKKENTFEETNPVEYVKWLLNKNVNANNSLITVIKLFKYLRDIKQNFSIKSILLNTLLGNCVYDNENSQKFRNIPTALYTFFERLNDFLNINKAMPIINNPVLNSENFNRHWDEEKYNNFREKIQLYFDKIQLAYYESSKEKSIKLWQEIFGECFPKKVEKDKESEKFKNIACNSKPWCMEKYYEY